MPNAAADQSPDQPHDPRNRARFRVYYEDTDALGVVYYANYFRFLERGRTEYLTARGHDIAALNAAGTSFVVAKVEADLKRPARLGDTLDVISDLRIPSPFKGVFDQRIERDGRLLVKATITMACLDSEGQLRRFPTELFV